jgi:hypothetical protein
MSYKTPYYVTLGAYLMLVTPEDQIVGLPVAITEVPDEGIEAQIAAIVEDCEARGLRVLAKDEYDVWAERLADREKQKSLNDAMRQSAEDHAIEPDLAMALLRRHKARPGGDA